MTISLLEVERREIAAKLTSVNGWQDFKATPLGPEILLTPPLIFAFSSMWTENITLHSDDAMKAHSNNKLQKRKENIY